MLQHCWALVVLVVDGLSAYQGLVMQVGIEIVEISIDFLISAVEIPASLINHTCTFAPQVCSGEESGVTGWLHPLLHRCESSFRFTLMSFPQLPDEEEW